MPTRPSEKIDEDALRIGRAIEILRRRAGLTQGQAAERVPDKADGSPGMTTQYWGMHETGKVPGIHKPTVQRKILDALGATPEQLAEAMAEVDPAAPRMSRISRELQGLGAPPAEREQQEAVFPTRDGPVVFRYPADLTPQGFKDLERYFAVFLQTKNDA